MKIGDLISSEAKWTKYCLGRDKEGQALKSFDTIYSTKYDKNGKIFYNETNLADMAKSYSLYGAIVKCYNVDSRDNVVDKLRRAIEQYVGKRVYIAQFNDDSSTQYEDVRAVVRIAGV